MRSFFLRPGWVQIWETSSGGSDENEVGVEFIVASVLDLVYVEA